MAEVNVTRRTTLRGGGALLTAGLVTACLPEREAPAAQKFFDPACDWAPEGDFDRCTEVDRFDFVLRLRQAPDRPVRPVG